VFDKLSQRKKLCEGLSAVILLGEELWVANDETCSVARLFYAKRNSTGRFFYSRHEHFELGNYLSPWGQRD
jgi:hypothetical protein